jgi:hypothetical protein
LDVWSKGNPRNPAPAPTFARATSGVAAAVSSMKFNGYRIVDAEFKPDHVLGKSEWNLDGLFSSVLSDRYRGDITEQSCSANKSNSTREVSIVEPEATLPRNS